MYIAQDKKEKPVNNSYFSLFRRLIIAQGHKFCTLKYHIDEERRNSRRHNCRISTDEFWFLFSEEWEHISHLVFFLNRRIRKLKGFQDH